ncbi:hypothetical protein GCM10023147_16340 [Tsukamurella soli]|uniref:mRNA interferase MazF n=1 Tax=Tsukamurella soli TaxID=644556 RepID=A0ABP8JEM8_9ACTN
MTVADGATRVPVEQSTAVDPSRLGDRVGHLDLPEMCAVDAALRLVFGPRTHGARSPSGW